MEILNEVELRKEQRIKEKIEMLKKEGKKPEEIKAELEKVNKNKKTKEVVVCNTVTDIQRRKIDKLMSDPTKEPYIPEPRKEWKPREPAEFVRHVMGSSAGAGSGEFHVYRGIRRREARRNEYLDKKGLKDELDEEFKKKLIENEIKNNKTTEKKRLKRQKKKQKKIISKKLKLVSIKDDKEGEESSSGEENKSEDEKHFVIGGK
ncbi:PRKR-interacting protein 1 homolog isoform X1 [Hydra vulgaris]|uniref:PRKR-interacting protein 1 n=1 Tax=Hydra vulgaris TaxID=6087 RepID=T2M5U0_HYDVU|nr:PRKR-interacting protein 1 homolog isoform X1 [Hydra vulgaris]